jgi:uncharacterized protein involved in exopolysaccharide biosynthesis
MEGSQANQDRVFDSTNLIVYLFNWRVPLLIVSLVAGVLAAIFSGPSFIDPLYEATVTVFPSTTNSISKTLLPQKNASRTQDFLEFGKEEEAEQLLQLLSTDEIRDSIILKYDLMRHYDIDPNGKYAITELYKTFASNISFRRTEFMSVEINVLDTKRDTGAMMANDIVGLLDEVKERIQNERALQGLKIIEGEYLGLRKEVQTLEDSLTQLRYKGVHDYETQSAVFSEQLATAIIETKPNSAAVRAIEQKLDTLAKYGGTYVSLRDDLNYMKEEVVKLKTAYDQAKVDVEQSLPTIFTVNNAYPAEKKKYPIRWLIVALSMLGAFTGTLISILIWDTIRSSRQKA